MRPLYTLWIPLLLLAAPAQAVVHDLPDGSANTTPPADDPGFANIGNRGGLSVVYLGNGWILTADHVPFGDSKFGGVPYPGLLHSKIQLQPEGAATLPPDLALWRLVEPWPNLPSLPIQAAPLSLFDPITMIGNGADRTAPTVCLGPAYGWGGAHNIRWGTNNVESFATVEAPNGSPTRETESLVTIFDCTCTETGTTEAQGANGDSGGGAFFKGGDGTWRLAGIIFSTTECASMTATKNDVTFIADLSVYRDQILLITAPVIPTFPPWGVALLVALLGTAGHRLLRGRR